MVDHAGVGSQAGSGEPQAPTMMTVRRLSPVGSFCLHGNSEAAAASVPVLQMDSEDGGTDCQDHLSRHNQKSSSFILCGVLCHGGIFFKVTCACVHAMHTVYQRRTSGILLYCSWP